MIRKIMENITGYWLSETGQDNQKVQITEELSWIPYLRYYLYCHYVEWLYFPGWS